MLSINIPLSPNRIGIMGELIGAASLAPLVESAVATLESRGFGAMVVSTGNSVGDELSAWDTLARSDCKGFIIHSDYLSNDQLARLISTRKNIVLANLNYVQVGDLAAAHLVNSGHRKIAVVTGPANRCSVQYRREGFAHYLNKSAPTDVQIQTFESPFTVEGGANAMRLLFASNFNPTAVYFHNDRMAIGALAECQKKGLHVPADLSILGCGDLQAAALNNPSICTIHLPLERVGENAALRVINMINGITAESALDINSDWATPTLVSRNSVRDLNKSVISGPNTDHRISKRERECLQWAANGKTSWEISQILGLTESTIIYHLRNATRKLDAANRLHAVAKALKASIIEF